MTIPTGDDAVGRNGALLPAAAKPEAGPATPFLSVLARVGTVLVGNGLYITGGFLANVLTANALEPLHFGYFSLALAIMSVASEACGTGLDLAMVRMANRDASRGAAHVGQILRASLHLKLGLGAAIAAALFALSSWLAHSMFANADLEAPIRWAAVGVIGTALFQHILARYQSAEQFRAYSVTKSANSLLKLAMLGTLWVAGWLSLDSALAVSVLVLFVSVAVGFALSGRAAGSAQAGSEVVMWREVLWLGRWMIVSHLLFSLYGRLDILFVGWLREGSDVGYYTVAWNLGFLIDLCTYSFITALLPQASRMRDRREFQDYGRRTLGACALAALAAMPMLVFVDPFIRLVFPAYLPAIEVFRVLFWGSLITLLTHPLYLIVYQRDRVELVALSNLVLAIVAAAGCWLLIPAHGPLGAAYAMVIARAVNGGLVLWMVTRELRALRVSE